MKKRILSLLLTFCMIFTMFPVSAFGEVTTVNDWQIFDGNDTNNLPETQEQIIQMMIKDIRFYAPWGTIIEAMKPDKIEKSSTIRNTEEFKYLEFPNINYSNVIYSNAGIKDVVDNLITEDFVKNKTDILNKLPEGADKAQDVFYVYGKNTKVVDNLSLDANETGYAYTIQLFYDFQIEGIPEKFESAQAEIGETIEDLNSKGIIYTIGGSSDGYSVTAENRNDYESTVDKSYSYEKSTSTATSVSNTYSKSWNEETAVNIRFKIPIISAKGSVTQSFGYSYGMDKTYDTSEEERYSQSITDKISVPLPAHTKLQIDVNVSDQKTTIPYNGSVYLKYKTTTIYVGCWEWPSFRQGPKYKHDEKVYTFGNDSQTAIDNLDSRIINRNVEGWNSDMQDLKSLYDNNTNGFKTAADDLCSGQPYAPYFGDFYYTSKNTSITPQKVVPLYPLDKLIPSAEEVTMYENQTKRLDSINVAAYNQYRVAYYGFNSAIDGKWQVIDANGNENTQYAQVTTDRNGYPILKALKPNDGVELYLRFAPNSTIEKTANFHSDEIPLTIKSIPVSDVTISGQFDEFILNDTNNKIKATDYLTVTAKDNDGNNFDTTGRVTWYAEENDGIAVNAESGDIEFTKAGTYQIYAMVNGTKSNPVALEVLPARELNEISIAGTIPQLIYDDNSKNTFDLSGITIKGKDQYGDEIAVPDNSWMVGSDLLENAADKISQVDGNTLKGLQAGTDTLQIKVGNIYSNSLSFTVNSSPYPVSLNIEGTIPDLAYNDDTAKSYDLTNLTITAVDQYGDNYPLDETLYQWTLKKGTANANISNNIITGKVVGQDELTLSYPTAAKDENGEAIGNLTAGPIAVNVVAKSYVKELYYNGGAPMAREGIAYDLSQIPLLAKDQYGDAITVPDDIEWSLADNNETAATIEGGKLTVTEGQVRDASVADVILKAYSPSADKTAENIIIKVRQQPVLTKLNAEMTDDFSMRIDENANLNEHFAVAGYDQYGDEFTPLDVTWKSSDNEIVSLADGILTAKQEGKSVEIYCEQTNSKNQTITSNKLTLRVTSPRRITSVDVADAPQTAKLNSTLDLNSLTALVYDQDKEEFTAEELAAYPASIRWTLEKNGTAATIDNNTLSFGNTPGTMTLVCAVVNTDTNVIAEKRIDIMIGLLTELTLSGDLGEIVLNDGDNKTDVSGLTLTAKGDDGSTYDTTGQVRWYAEETDGITVDTENGNIEFDKAGTYHIYAMVKDVKSNSVTLTVKPARELKKITIEGEIPDLLWDDNQANTFDLTQLTVKAVDQYGDEFTIPENSWKVDSDNQENESDKISEINGNTLKGLKVGTDNLKIKVGTVESNSIEFTVKDAPYPVSLNIEGTIPDLVYNDDTAKSYDLTKLAITAVDQYGEDYQLDTDLFEWTLKNGKDYATVKDNVITGKVVGNDQLTLSYPTGKRDGNEDIIYLTAGPLAVNVILKTYVEELWYNGGAPMAREGIAYDLSQIPLLAKDQHGNEIAVPADIKWRLANNNETEAVIEDGKLTVAEGQVPYASVADVILEAYSPSADKTAVDVIVKVRQQPLLTELKATMQDGFTMQLDENVNLKDYFSVKGYDQYNDEFTPLDVTWKSSDNEIVSLENGVLTAKQEGKSVKIYCEQLNGKNETITSNEIELQVTAPRRITTVDVVGEPKAVKLNDTLDLNTLTASVYDQNENVFNAEELAAYPASIRWTLEKNGTDAVIDNNTLSFGGTQGTMTLICAVVNADTNVIVEKRMDILVGLPYIYEFTPAESNLKANGGTVEFTIKGINLTDGILLKANDEITAETTGTDSEQKATLTFPANDANDAVTYTVTNSIDETNTAKVTVAQASSGGFGGGGGSVSTEYTLSFDTDGGNAIKAVTAEKGTVIDLSKYVPVKDGYTFDGWYADKALTKAVTSVKLTENTTVYAKWTANGNIEMPFTDVKESDWFYGDVQYVYTNGIMNGISDTLFGPQESTSRGMIVTMLYRLEGEPDVNGSNQFTDVDENAYYANAVKWASQCGIVTGYSEDIFAPDQNITREQIAAIFYRYAEYKGYDVTAQADLTSYTDSSKISPYAVPAMKWAVASGLIVGNDNKLDPQADVVRCQTAAIFHRFCTKIAE